MVSKLSAGGGLTIIQMKELDSLDPILDFEDADMVQAPSDGLLVSPNLACSGQGAPVGASSPPPAHVVRNPARDSHRCVLCPCRTVIVQEPLSYFGSQPRSRPSHLLAPSALSLIALLIA